NAYFRGYWQHHLDGNNTEAQACKSGIGVCFGDDTTTLNGAGGLVFPSSTVFGQLDRTLSNAAGYGGPVPATSTAKIFDRPNNIVIGASIDRGHMQFNAVSELGTLDQNLFVNGTGVIINQPFDPLNPNQPSLAPVSLLSDTTYTGIYATDTFEIT